MNHLAQAFVALTKPLSGSTVTSFLQQQRHTAPRGLEKCTLKNTTEVVNKTAF